MRYTIHEKFDKIGGSTKAEVVNSMIELFRGTQQTSILYYSGHGQGETEQHGSTGSWCLKDGLLHAPEIIEAWIKYSFKGRKSERKRLVIIADCCFSANI
jgi:hypothetical protein